MWSMNPSLGKIVLCFHKLQSQFSAGFNLYVIYHNLSGTVNKLLKGFIELL